MPGDALLTSVLTHELPWRVVKTLSSAPERQTRFRRSIASRSVGGHRKAGVPPAPPGPVPRCDRRGTRTATTGKSVAKSSGREQSLRVKSYLCSRQLAVTCRNGLDSAARGLSFRLCASGSGPVPRHRLRTLEREAGRVSSGDADLETKAALAVRISPRARGFVRLDPAGLPVREVKEEPVPTAGD